MSGTWVLSVVSIEDVCELSEDCETCEVSEETEPSADDENSEEDDISALCEGTLTGSCNWQPPSNIGSIRSMASSLDLSGAFPDRLKYILNYPFRKNTNRVK